MGSWVCLAEDNQHGARDNQRLTVFMYCAVSDTFDERLLRYVLLVDSPAVALQRASDPDTGIPFSSTVSD